MVTSWQNIGANIYIYIIAKQKGHIRAKQGGHIRAKQGGHVRANRKVTSGQNTSHYMSQVQTGHTVFAVRRYALHVTFCSKNTEKDNAV